MGQSAGKQYSHLPTYFSFLAAPSSHSFITGFHGCPWTALKAAWPCSCSTTALGLCLSGREVYRHLLRPNLSPPLKKHSSSLNTRKSSTAHSRKWDLFYHVFTFSLPTYIQHLCPHCGLIKSQPALPTCQAILILRSKGLNPAFSLP